MTTRFLTLLFSLLLAATAGAQTLDSVTITTASSSCLASNCVSVNVRGVASIGISVEGAGTYELWIEGTRNNGTTWRRINVVDDTDQDALTNALVGPGSFSFPNSGYHTVRVRAEALSVGTPVVVLTRGELAPLEALGGGGGGGGGSATEYTEGASDASITGLAALMEVAGDVLRPLQGSVADGLLVNLGSNNDVTVTGTVTANLSATDNAVLDDIADGIAVTGTVTANAGTNLNTSALALESGGNLAAVATSLAALDNAVAGNELQVDVLTMPTVTVTDGAGSMNVIVDSGSVSCSNCSGSGASDVDDSSFSLTSDSVAPAGFLLDDSGTDSVDEGDVGLARMSANRVQYGIIRDGASGAERGVSVTAQNELLVELGAGSAAIGTVTVTDGSGALNVIVDSGAVTVSDGSGALTVDGSISCSNCSGSGASAVDDAAFTVATDSVAPAGFLLDDSSPDTVNEGDVGLGRMSSRREQYVQIRDAAGNERGLNIDSSGRITVVPSAADNPTFVRCSDGSIASPCSVTLSTSDTDDGTIAGSQSVALAAAMMHVWNGSNWVRATNADATADATALTTGPQLMGMRDDALSTLTPAEGDASQLLINARGALWTVLDTAGITNLDVQIGGSDTLSVNPGTAANWGVYVEDAGETAGGNLMMSGAVVRSSATGSSATAGDNATINVDTLGRLWTRPGGPCADHARITTAAINTSSSGNVEIVALNGSDLIEVCGYSIVAGAATGVQLIYGTGTACATGETDLTGVWSFAANGGITQANAGVPQFVVPAGNAFCIENSGANSVQGHVTYVRTAAP